MVLHKKSFIFNISIYAKYNTPYFKCNKVSNLWQQLKFASGLGFDLRRTVDWSKKRFFDFIAEKTQLVSFDSLNNCDAIDVKMNGSVLDKKLFFKML